MGYISARENGTNLGQCYLPKDYVTGGVGPCSINEDLAAEEFNCGPINSTVCKPSSLVAYLIFRLKFKFD